MCKSQIYSTNKCSLLSWSSSVLHKTLYLFVMMHFRKLVFGIWSFPVTPVIIPWVYLSHGNMVSTVFPWHWSYPRYYFNFVIRGISKLDFIVKCIGGEITFERVLSFKPKHSKLYLLKKENYNYYFFLTSIWTYDVYNWPHNNWRQKFLWRQ